MTVEQFPGGHSNLTYLLRFGAQEFVMRRPPFGPVPPKAHDMAREYRILAAVHPVFPLAPRPFVLCEDTRIIGATFYLMERRRGLVVRDSEPPELFEQPAQRRRASVAMVDALASLHAVDISVHRLAALGKPAGFVARQVRGWTDRWHGSQTNDLPEMDARAELLERYGARTDFDLSDITFYEVFAVFKLAVVLQQIFYRYRRGQTDDPRFAMLDERVMWLARIGTTLAEIA